MRILQVADQIETQGHGGIEVFTYDLARSLARQGIEVAVLCLRRVPELRAPRIGERLESGLRTFRLETHPPPEPFGLQTTDPELERAFLALLDRQSFDAVHFQCARPGLPFSLFGVIRSTGRPVFVTLHDLWFACARCALARRRSHSASWARSPASRIRSTCSAPFARCLVRHACRFMHADHPSPSLRSPRRRCSIPA